MSSKAWFNLSVLFVLIFIILGVGSLKDLAAIYVKGCSAYVLL